MKANIQLRTFYQILMGCHTCFLGMTLGACATDQGIKAAKNAPPVSQAPTHYLLKAGQRTEFTKPFPDLQQVLVVWQRADGTEQEAPGFRTWDVDGDGIAEMVEVVGPDGKALKYFFDFNEDGVLDWEKEPLNPGQLSLELD